MLDVKRSSSHSKLLQRILARVDHELKNFYSIPGFSWNVVSDFSKRAGICLLSEPGISLSYTALALCCTSGSACSSSSIWLCTYSVGSSNSCNFDEPWNGRLRLPIYISGLLGLGHIRFLSSLGE